MTHLLMLGAVVAASSAAHGQLVYLEDVDGDLSNDVLNPTPLLLEEGANILAGSVHGPGQKEFDVFTITIPDGLALESVILVDYFANDPEDHAVGFIAFNEGTVFVAEPNNDSIADNLANFLGYNHLGQVQNIDAGPNQVGTDILPGLADGIEGFTPPIGFDTPLGAGDYTFYIQQTGPNDNFYEMQWNVIPAPSAALALLLLAAPRRRR